MLASGLAWATSPTHQELSFPAWIVTWSLKPIAPVES